MAYGLPAAMAAGQAVSDCVRVWLWGTTGWFSFLCYPLLLLFFCVFLNLTDLIGGLDMTACHDYEVQSLAQKSFFIPDSSHI